jgi:hypothetical protein
VVKLSDGQDARPNFEEAQRMALNFFQWIREGVRHSVIAGVSDAVQDLGTPHEGDNMQGRLMGFLKDDRPAAAPPRLTNEPSRKKLGRTLQQIQASTNAAPGT